MNNVIICSVQVDEKFLHFLGYSIATGSILSENSDGRTKYFMYLLHVREMARADWLITGLEKVVLSACENIVQIKYKKIKAY